MYQNYTGTEPIAVAKTGSVPGFVELTAEGTATRSVAKCIGDFMCEICCMLSCVLSADNKMFY